MRLSRCVLPAVAVLCCLSLRAESLPRPDHVVIVVLENHSFNQVIGSPDAPYINSLAARGALFTQSFGITHPSFPNYLALFAGSTLGVSSNKCSLRTNKSSIGAELITAGFSFIGYAENLPSVGYGKCSAKGGYVAEHNPWVHFRDLPPEVNQPFTNFPTDLTTLPTLSFVVPTGTARSLSKGDQFLQTNLDPYVQFAQTHNSLLIVTFDEDNKHSGNHIPTIFVGPMVIPGSYDMRINHFNVSRTIEDMYGLPLLGRTPDFPPITGIWTTPPVAMSNTRETPSLPRPDHIVIVFGENTSFGGVIGNKNAPYMNSLAANGAVFTSYTQITHPSLPNYVAMFSGSTQRLHDQKCGRKFNAPNMQTELAAAGLTFVGYAESLPNVGFIGCNKGAYVRKHNPWVHFTNFPPELNQPFSNFPTDFTQLPTVSFIVPNESHSGSVKKFDAWLQQNLDAYAQFAATHNSLLIVTFDEGSSSHIIPAIFYGQVVKPGQYSEKVTHYNTHRTIEDMYGLQHIGNPDAMPITDVWQTVPVPMSAHDF